MCAYVDDAVERWGLWIMGEGVRCCLRRDFMYSDSNWNSSEGGDGGSSSSCSERRAEERAWRAVIGLNGDESVRVAFV